MLAAAYVVVMFSLIVQGVTIERLIKHTLLTASSMQPSSQRLGISDVPKK
jgi:NhaP-type Na+/H+ or K+/H+ antiporter